MERAEEASGKGAEQGGALVEGKSMLPTQCRVSLSHLHPGTSQNSSCPDIDYFEQR